MNVSIVILTALATVLVNLIVVVIAGATILDAIEDKIKEFYEQGQFKEGKINIGMGFWNVIEREDKPTN